MLRDLPLLIFVIGLIPFILRKAWIGALAWTWIGLMNPHLYSWTLREFPFAQLIGVTFLAGWLVSREKRMVEFTPEMIGLLVLFTFVMLKTPFSWQPDVAWTYVNQYAKIVIAMLLCSTLIHTPQRVRWFLWVIMISLGFYGLKGGVFALLSGGNERVQGPEPSFIGGNTHLGVALLMVMPLFLAFSRDASNVWWKRAGVAAFWLTLLSVIFTYSRGAWLGVCATAPLLFLQSKRKLLSSLALVPILVGLVAFTPEKVFERFDTIAEYQQDLSSMQRVQGWGVAVNVALRHPLGSGFVLDATPVDEWMSYANFTHPEFDRANAAHSIYFQWIGDHGFLSLALFIFTVLASLVTLQRVRRVTAPDPQRRWLGEYAAAIQIGLIGYLVSGAFVSLAYFDLFYTYVVLAGILLRETRAPVAKPAAGIAPATAALRPSGSVALPSAAPPATPPDANTARRAAQRDSTHA